MIKMRIAGTTRSIGWLLTAAVIGALSASFIGTALAQQGAQQGPRLRFINTGNTVPAGGTLQFISDLKSGGCWLAGLGPNGNLSTLAAAPPDACR